MYFIFFKLYYLLHLSSELHVLLKHHSSNLNLNPRGTQMLSAYFEPRNIFSLANTERRMFGGFDSRLTSLPLPFFFFFGFAYPRRAEEVTPRFNPNSMADRRMISGAAVRKVRQTGALLPRLMEDSEPGETQGPRASPWETKGLFRLQC